MVEAYVTPAADFLFLDGLEPIKLEISKPNGNHEITVAKALGGPVDLRRDTFVEVALGSRSKAWSFPVSDLDGQEINVGDVITDSSGLKWEVAGVTLRSFDQVYRCPCNRMRVNG